MMTDIKLWWRILRIKVSHWEYWNSTIIYLPVLPYLIFLWIKSKSIFFFNAANPGIEYGGFLMESKWKIHHDAPEGFFPKTLLMHPSYDLDSMMESIRATFHFPFIAKPDSGSQGRGVVVIKNMQHLRTYHQQCPVPYIIQKKIDYPMEVGIFYVRMPNSARGKITGIVRKEFIQVTGDGRSSLCELLMQNQRYILQIIALHKLLGSDAMDSVIPENEQRTVIDIGNHARGALFIDTSNRISEQLTNAIDTLCQSFKGFYFGRLDIRFKSWESLERGEDFAVIELNGSGSEPTHIYDPAHSIFYAWKEICKHWKMMQEISSYNREHGVAYLSWGEGIAMFRNNERLNKKLAQFECATSIDHVKENVSWSVA